MILIKYLCWNESDVFWWELNKEEDYFIARLYDNLKIARPSMTTTDSQSDLLSR